MKPTDEQIALLYDLKRGASETFYYPPTSAHAVAEIARLRVNADRREPAAVGARVELARYAVSAGERIICGQRVDGVVRVVDKPVGRRGRSFLIERGVESLAELDALVAEYVADSTERDRPAVLMGGDDA